ncbi:hypothetical protein EDC04DRAFT_2538459, partial [Pisolithus marmoratus]
KGYTRVLENVEMKEGYNYSHVACIVTVTNGCSTIDIVISRTWSAIPPIFQFHSTAIMNFISGDTIFCSYLMLTLHHLSLANAGPLYFGEYSRGMIDAMLKYVTWGFH